MAKTLKLSERQRERLGILEPALRNAVRLGDYEGAKRITADIQSLLRPTGHETRLMQAKNWLFEAAMEAGKLETAVSGFEGVRKLVARRTRVYLEATALLAVCHIRRRDLESAEPLIREVLASDSIISSERRRRQFRLRVVSRFEEEGVLAALEGNGEDLLVPDEIETAAAKSVQTKSEDEMFADLGSALPPATVAYLLRIDELAKRQLPASEIRYLPPAQDLLKHGQLGRTTFHAVKRVLWRSLCDPESELYKAWFKNGISAVLDKKYISTCVIGALGGFNIALGGLVVSLVALLFKFGIEVYCEKYRPDGLMIARDE
jgi:hypothetical protein